MAGEFTHHTEVRCPTCGARQPSAAECRRCKSDLRLYLAALAHCRLWKDIARQRLGQDDYLGAVEAAEQAWAASPDAESARLLAVAQLLAGRFDAALAAYNMQAAAAE